MDEASSRWTCGWRILSARLPTTLFGLTRRAVRSLLEARPPWAVGQAKAVTRRATKIRMFRFSSKQKSNNINEATAQNHLTEIILRVTRRVSHCTTRRGMGKGRDPEVPASSRLIPVDPLLFESIPALVLPKLPVVELLIAFAIWNLHGRLF